jgi:hypothetical protein
MPPHIVTLGFYDRHNLGDDSYVYAFTKIFPDIRISFLSMDDVQQLPSDTTMVICGGGDIINDYFMLKAQQILKDFKGLVYAVSVGIPYLTGSKYLHLFDHVFTRSVIDYQTAVHEIGTRNVTRIDDATFVLAPSYNADFIPASNVIRVGIALAHPVFYNNTGSYEMIQSIATALVDFYTEHDSRVEYHILAFNHNVKNVQECDYLVNQTLYQHLQENGIPVLLRHDINDIRMIDYININIDLMLCMRYHSVVFSFLTGTRFLALYTTPKVNNFLQTYFEDSMSDHYSLELDINAHMLFEKLELALSKPAPTPPTLDTSLITNVINAQKSQDILITSQLQSFDNVLNTCKRSIIKYLNIDAEVYDGLLKARGSIVPYLGNKAPLSFARLVCYLISNQIGDPCVWGLAENLQKPDFCLFEAIKYIWNRCNDVVIDAQKAEHYYAKPAFFSRRVLVNMDYIFQSDFSSHHRSGWAHVVGGLMNLDGPRLARKVEGNVFIDTYVDRSFHWGRDILEMMNVIPYIHAWIGFVHHTFDKTHSDYNCHTLFKVPQFLESLKTCKGLISLTKHHANDMRRALDEAGFPNVRVHVIYHPMEFVDKTFTMEKFLENPRKKIIQIGAWMRNPYAIYQLPIHDFFGTFTLTKAGLKGRDMDQYFAPPEFLEVMQEALFKTDWNHITPCDTTHDIITAHYCCRPGASETNKFCQGVYNMLEYQTESVEVIDKVANSEYDDLLAENIVFLNLVDCSAVNTVIECIVRNTVLIVNRHPALEEMLGVNYPGFYDNLTMAAQMCLDLNVIAATHNYLVHLNKERYTLAFFLDRFQEVVEYDACAVPQSIETVYSYRNVLRDRYQRLMWFLPNIFSL